MKKVRLLTILAATLFIGCDAFEYHPYDGNIKGDTDINIKNIARIEEACAGKDTIRFVWIGDTQGWYDETKRFVKAVNARDDVDFVIHGGDISNYGTTREFEWMRDIMNKLKVPYVAVVGNHDCLGSGREVFKKVFGETNFAFQAGDVRFINLETSSLGIDYSIPIPDFQFIEQELAKRGAGWNKTVVTMHAPPFCDEFNNNVARVFQRYIKEFPQLQFCTNAHHHQLAVNDYFSDSTLYFCCNSIDKRDYLLFTIIQDSYSYEVVDF